MIQVSTVPKAKHSVDSVASYSSQNHVDRIRTQNFSAASCQDDSDFGSIKTSLFRRSSCNLEHPQKRPESVISTTSSTRSRLRELVERKSNQEENKAAANTVGDIQYFENPTETLEFDGPRNLFDSKKEERPKKRKLSKSKEKEKDLCEHKNKKHEKYQSKLAEYYKVPAQLPQDDFYQHLTRSRAAEELLQKRFSNSDTEFNGSYGRLCKHKEPEGSNLRRSRSLAVIREETFNDLQIQNHNKNKRSQLIPRARLFDKPCFKDRLVGRAKYQTKEEVLEGIYIDSTASCFGDINGHTQTEDLVPDVDKKSNKEDVISRNESHHSRSLEGSWPNINDELKPTNLSEDSIGHSRNPSEIDSLDSNYVRKHYNFEAHLKNCKDSSPDTNRSIPSPESHKQIYLTDEQDTDNEIRDRSKTNTPKSFTNDSLSITNSDNEKIKTVDINNDNQVNLICNESSLTCEYIEIKDNLEESNEPDIYPIEIKNEDNRSLISENDGTISSPPDSVTSYISISIDSSTDKSHKLEYLANSLAAKIDEYCESQLKQNVSVPKNTIYSENNNLESVPIYVCDKKDNKNKTDIANINKDPGYNQNSDSIIFNELSKKQNNEVYISNTYIENDTKSVTYNCTSRNITTEPFVTTLIENQYYSLPDINISKCLRKSERIDAQLREEDPEDISYENTYEIAQTNFEEIFPTKSSDFYGHINKSYGNQKLDPKINSNIHLNEYSHPSVLQSFNKLDEDLKSIITVDSSTTDDKELNFYTFDTHQNEREINEIEGTIRNNKVITKSESLAITNSVYKPQINIAKSLSNDNINKTLQEKKERTAVRKHYSLRQRQPTTDDIPRVPSPSTVEKITLPDNILANKSPETEVIKTPLLSRVQSFKTSAESEIAIVPLSGHQTLVINPPLTQEPKVNIKQNITPPEKELITKKTYKETDSVYKTEIESNSKPEQIFILKEEENTTSDNCNKSSINNATNPFVTIKLNKIVKTTVPKLTKDTHKTDKIQYKFEKPPSRLIIKDDRNFSQTNVCPKVNSIMTRPQILQVVDSKNNKLDTTDNNYTMENKVSEFEKPESNLEIKEELKFYKDSNVKEKLNNAIKTDIEYQEKLHSVKNYWSSLIDKGPNSKDINKSDDNYDCEKSNNNNTNDSNEPKVVDKNENYPMSVGSIVKSLESVKIVDSIRKISQTRTPLWKDETEKVKSDSEIEETTVKKIIKECEDNIWDKSKGEKHIKKSDCNLYRDTPEIEIVELSSDDNNSKKTQATLIKARGYEKGCDEFDHVRYKVMKSELFKNSMIANYRKEAQFDGLLQYLQDYSFQELLVNNNIVIIEPVRTKVEPTPRKINTDTRKISPSLLKKNDSISGQVEKPKNFVRRHFFYHPIRVNREIIEEELPNPDTVKKVRNLFEDTLKMKSPMSMTQDPPLIDDSARLTRRATSYRNVNEETKINKLGGRKKVIRQLTIDTNYGNKKWDNASLSSGVSSGDLSSNNEYEADGISPYSNKNLKDNVYSSSDEYLCDSVSQDFCCESQYVSPDILKKIRECGTSVTYYGGKVLNSKTGSSVSPMTKAIMEEIKSLQKNCSRDCYSCQTKCHGDKCSCLTADKHQQMRSDKQNSSSSLDSGEQDQDKDQRKEGFPGFKFKLVKSNSCSSRLELTGTDENKNPRFKYIKQQPKMEDPPLVYDDENSVKNKICRLESYNKGITKSPFENKDKEDKIPSKTLSVTNKFIEKTVSKAEVAPQQQNPVIITTQDEIDEKQDDEMTDDSEKEKSDISDPHSFEKKFYYVNENLHQTKTTTGKFGEMVFEEFEVLESCYDSLNSNK